MSITCVAHAMTFVSSNHAMTCITTQRGEMLEAMRLYERAYEIEPQRKQFRDVLSKFTQSKYHDKVGLVSTDEPRDPVEARLKEHEEHW